MDNNDIKARLVINMNILISQIGYCYMLMIISNVSVALQVPGLYINCIQF